MSNVTATRPVIRASLPNIAAAAEFLSLLFDAPVTITASDEVVATPTERHLILIVSETGGSA